MSVPFGVNHVTSVTPSPRIDRPWKNFRRCSTGCSDHSRVTRRTNAKNCCWSSAKSQFQPAQLVVLAVRVVVAALRVAQFVAGEHHRHALRQHQRGDEVPLLAGAERNDLRVVGRPLDAAVPRGVVVGPVAVVLAVGRVVLVVVTDEVFEAEPVVARDEVDARVRLAAASTRTGRWTRTGGWRTPARCRRRPSRTCGRCRGTCRSTRSSPAGSCRPGNRPAPRPTARRSASTRLRIGSWWMMSKNAPSLFTSNSSRARVLARSKRNPSTCMSVTQYRRLSMMSWRTFGCCMFSVLPQPVKSM